MTTIDAELFWPDGPPALLPTTWSTLEGWTDRSGHPDPAEWKHLPAIVQAKVLSDRLACAGVKLSADMTDGEARRALDALDDIRKIVIHLHNNYLKSSALGTWQRGRKQGRTNSMDDANVAKKILHKWREKVARLPDRYRDHIRMLAEALRSKRGLYNHDQAWKHAVFCVKSSFVLAPVETLCDMGLCGGVKPGSAEAMEIFAAQVEHALVIYSLTCSLDNSQSKRVPNHGDDVVLRKCLAIGGPIQMSPRVAEAFLFVASASRNCGFLNSPAATNVGLSDAAISMLRAALLGPGPAVPKLPPALPGVMSGPPVMFPAVTGYVPKEEADAMVGEMVMRVEETAMQLEMQREQATALEREVQLHREQAAGLHREVEVQRERAAGLHREVQVQVQRAGGLERELQECKSLNERCREEVEGAMATITHVVKEKEDLQKKAAVLRARLEAESAKRELADAKLREAEERIQKHRSSFQESTKLQMLKEHLEKLLREAKGEASRAREERDEARRERDEARRECELKRREWDQMRRQRGDLQRELAQAHDSLREAAQRRAQERSGQLERDSGAERRAEEAEARVQELQAKLERAREESHKSAERLMNMEQQLALQRHKINEQGEKLKKHQEFREKLRALKREAASKEAGSKGGASKDNKKSAAAAAPESRAAKRPRGAGRESGGAERGSRARRARHGPAPEAQSD